VLLNLFTNAFYAVRQRQQQGEPGYAPTVHVRTQREGDEVVVQVQDNGTGMNEAVQQKIFQPFFTTKPTGEGTGLGLSLSYDIVTKGHGGTLEVASQLGVGTTFTLRLPC
jgi:signal transduction histidine kinase